MARIKWSEQIGQIINGFQILDVKRESKRTYVFVVCPFCGKKFWMRAEAMTKNKSCGCYNIEHNVFQAKDIKGRKFGRLTAVRKTDKKAGNGSAIWECECECGSKDVLVSASNLTGGRVKSCGCLQKETMQKNGKAMMDGMQKYYVEGTSVKALTSKIPKNNTSGYKGVSWDSSRNKWMAQIVFKGITYHLGRYCNKKDAVAVRKLAENKMFGEFLEWYAKNFPKEWDSMQKNKNK